MPERNLEEYSLALRQIRTASRETLIRQLSGGNQQKAIQARWLATDPDIDAVISENDNMTFGAVDAIKEAGRTCGPKIKEIILALEAGKTVAKVQYMDETYFDTSMDLEAILKTRAY